MQTHRARATGDDAIKGQGFQDPIWHGGATRAHRVADRGRPLGDIRRPSVCERVNHFLAAEEVVDRTVGNPVSRRVLGQSYIFSHMKEKKTSTSTRWADGARSRRRSPRNERSRQGWRRKSDGANDRRIAWEAWRRERLGDARRPGRGSVQATACQAGLEARRQVKQHEGK
jgi:hypothetical protein